MEPTRLHHGRFVSAFFHCFTAALVVFLLSTGSASAFLESFEDTEIGQMPPAGWVKWEVAGGRGWSNSWAGRQPIPGWMSGTNTTPPGGGSRMAYVSYTHGGSKTNDLWLVSPLLKGVVATSTVSFWYRTAFSNFADNLYVMISTNGRSSYTDFNIQAVHRSFPRGIPVGDFQPWSNMVFNIGSMVPPGTDCHIAFREYYWNNWYDVRANELDLIESDLWGVPSFSITNFTMTGPSTIDVGYDIYDGDAPSGCGICWGPNSPPVIGDNIGQASIDGRATCVISNIPADATYYFRAFATNSHGAFYGDEVYVLYPGDSAGEGYLFESFETTPLGHMPPSGWEKWEVAGGRGWSNSYVGRQPMPGWMSGTNTTPPGGGSRMAYVTYTHGGAKTNDLWLVSPEIKNTPTNLDLSFWYRTAFSNFADNLYVMISTNGKSSYTDFDIEAVHRYYPRGVPTDGDFQPWSNIVVDVGALVTPGSDIYVAFREYYNNNWYDVRANELDLIEMGSQVRGALRFDGNDDYIMLPLTNNTTAYTIEAWVRPLASGAMNILTRNAGDPATTYSHQLRLTAGGVFEHYIDDGGAKTVTGTTVVQTGQWYHVCGVAQNGGNMRLFVNGVEEGSAAAVGTMWAGGNQYRAGCASGGGFGFFEGDLDEIRVWSRVLSDSERLDLMNAYARGLDTTMLGCYRLDQTWSTNVYDSSATVTNGNMADTSPVWVSAATPQGDASVAKYWANRGIWANQQNLTMTRGLSIGSSISGQTNFLVFGDNNGTGHTTADVPSQYAATGSERLSRVWCFDLHGETNQSLDLSFNLTNSGSADLLLADAGSYYLLRRAGASGTFSVLQVGADSVSAGEVTFSSVDVNEGYYTIGLLAPDAPEATAASAVTAYGFQANWNAVTAATNYFLDASVNSGFSSYMDGYSNRVVGNVLFAAVTGAAPSTVHYYRVRAQRAGVSSTNSASISVTTLSEGSIGTDPAMLNFSSTYGSNPVAQTYILTNSGQTVYNYSNSLAYSVGATGWMTMLASNGTMAAGESLVHTATVASAALNVGTYYVTNSILSPTATNSPYLLVTELVVSKGGQTIAFGNPGAQIATNKVGLAATASSGLGVSFAVGSGPGAIANGTNLTFTAAGTVSIVASQAGNGNYNPAPSVTNTFAVTRSDQTVSFGNPGPQITTNNIGLAATASSGLGVSFAVGSGPASIASGTNLTFTGDGTVRIVASQAGDALYNAAPSVTNTFLVTRADQSISFGNPGAQDTTNKVGLAATSSSGLGVSFAVGTGSATIAGATNLSFTAAGNVSVVASQAGNVMYDAAPDVTNTFAVTKAVAGVVLNSLAQTYDGTARTVTATTTPNGLTVGITYDNNAWAPTNAGTYTITGLVNEVMYQGGTTDTLTVAKADQTIVFASPGAQETTNKVGLAATASTGFTVSFAVGSGPGSINGGTNLSFTGEGNVSIVASQIGDGNYNAAPDITNTFMVTKAVAGVTLNNMSQTYNGSARIVTATTAPNGLTVDFTYGNNAWAPTNAGTYVVTGLVNEAMYQGGNTGDLTVAKANQTVVFPAIPAQSYTSSVGLAATASSSLPVGFSVGAGPGVIASGTNLTFTGVGSVSIVASQAGDGNYNVAPSVTNTFTVSKADQAISFGNPGAQETTNRVGLAASADSGLGVSFAVGSGPGSIAGGTNLTFTGAGTVRIVASQAGDANYNVASSVTNTFAVTKAVAGVVLNNLAQTYDGSARTVTATTTPNGLTVNFTYGNNAWAPTNAGTYVVTGLVNEVMYQGGNTGALTVAKANQTIVFANPGAQETTNRIGLAATASSALGASFAVGSGPGSIAGGTNLTFTGAGNVSIVASQIGDGNYNAAPDITNTFMVTKAVAGVVFNNLNQSYDGSARIVTATTTPNGLTVGITYDNNVWAPTNVGTYTITGLVNEAIYQGGRTDTLTVVKGNQAIVYTPLGTQVYTNRVGLAATANSGLTVAFAVASGPGVLASGTNLSFSTTGVVALVLSQAGDASWNEAPSLTNVFAVRGLPPEIDSPTSSGIGASTAVLGGTVTATNDTPVTERGIYWSGVNGFADGAGTKVSETGSFGVGSFTVGVTGLTTGSTNYFKAFASNVEGVRYTAQASFLTKPAAPGPVASTNITTSGFALNWGAAVGSTNYYLDVTNSVGYVAGYSNLVCGAVNTCAVTGLVSETVYYACVRARNAAGLSTNSAVASVATMSIADISVTPSILNYSATYGATNPASQVVTVTNSGDAAFFTNVVVYSGGSGWLTALPASGGLAAGGRQAVTCSVDIAGMDAGTHYAMQKIIGTAGANVCTASVSVTLTMSKGNQSITFANPGEQIVTNIVTLSATASSGLPVSFSVQSGPAVISGGNLLSFTDPGSVVIVASQVGNTNWNAAPGVTNSFDVISARPDAPTGVSASDGTYGNRIVITWNAVTDAASYEVWRSTGSDSGSAVRIAYGETARLYEDRSSSVRPRDVYYYWVKAVNGYGVSEFSLSDSGYRRPAVNGDYTGNGSSDMAVYDASTGNWYIRDTQGNIVTNAAQWGGPGYTSVPGDYDGDGVNDMAVYESVSGKWYIRTMGGTVILDGEQYGGQGYQPVPGDYNADGVHDLAVYEQASGLWSIRGVDGTVILSSEQWGGESYIPVPGDYNGDGASDMAVYHQSTGVWYIRFSEAEAFQISDMKFEIAPTAQWGGAGFTPVPGDYNGDDVDDLAVYEQSTGLWYIRTLGGTTLVNGDQFGGAGYSALSGDFNGDGTSDLAVYDMATGQWYINTVTGEPVVEGDQWGGSAYTPTSEVDAPVKPAGLTSVYRFYSYGNAASTYEHFFTAGLDEAAMLNGLAFWTFETVCWYALPVESADATELYRAYNAATEAHYWTTDSATYYALMSRGWIGEGAGMYVWATGSGGRAPVYQFYNPAIDKYLYTSDEYEKMVLVSDARYGYTYEGIAFYVYDSP